MAIVVNDELLTDFFGGDAESGRPKWAQSGDRANHPIGGNLYAREADARGRRDGNPPGGAPREHRSRARHPGPPGNSHTVYYFRLALHAEIGARLLSLLRIVFSSMPCFECGLIYELRFNL